ncbi:hypothetical protein [Micromonospora ureilytica]|uniref:hypothetical protein n=1 Tax=Micromonospora ureilytica TaxID=709868 RepID=UPI00403A07F7
MTDGQVQIADGLHRSFDALRTVLDETPHRPTRVRYSHQPNVLASLAVLTPCVAAPITARRAGQRADFIITWVSTDYDGADDEQFLRVRLPRTRPAPATRMTPALGRRWAGRRLASSIPSSAVLTRLASLEQEVVHAALALRHHLARLGWPVSARRTCRQRITEGFAALRHTLGTYRRLPDALAGHNTWMIEQVFGVHVSVHGGTDWLLGQAKQRLETLALVAAARPELLGAGIWRVCSRCHVRTRVECGVSSSSLRVTEGSCGGCGHVLGRGPIDLTATVDSPAGPCPEFVPLVHLDDLMERLVDPGFDLAVHYPGSFSHLAASRAALLPLLDGALSGYPKPAPDWCPTHLDLIAFVDSLFPDRLSRRPTRAEDATAFQILYRSSALVAWSILSGPSTASKTDCHNVPTGEPRG